MTEPETDQIPGDACVRCRGQLTEWGVYEFRTGGTTGTSKLLFGEWAELGEDMFPFEVRACRACGHVELRLPPSSG